MRIKLSETNNTKIQTALDQVNKRAKAFTVTNPAVLGDYAARAEEKLKGILPKAGWKGARVECRPAGPSASSYGYPAKSTDLVLERGARDWFLVQVTEAHVRSGDRSICEVHLSPCQTIAAELYAAKKLRADFRVKDMPLDASAHERAKIEIDARKIAGVF